MFSKILASKNQTELIRNILSFIIFVIIFAFVFRFIWNKALVPYVSVLNPVTTLVDALLLSVGINLLR